MGGRPLTARGAVILRPERREWADAGVWLYTALVLPIYRWPASDPPPVYHRPGAKRKATFYGKVAFLWLGASLPCVQR